MLENNLRNANKSILELTKQITELKAGQINLVEPAPVEEIKSFIENDEEIISLYGWFVKNGIKYQTSNDLILATHSKKNLEQLEISHFIKSCILYVKHRNENNAFNRVSYDDFLNSYLKELEETQSKEVAPVEIK